MIRDDWLLKAVNSNEDTVAVPMFTSSGDINNDGLAIITPSLLTGYVRGLPSANTGIKYINDNGDTREVWNPNPLISITCYLEGSGVTWWADNEWIYCSLREFSVPYGINHPITITFQVWSAGWGWSGWYTGWTYTIGAGSTYGSGNMAQFSGYNWATISGCEGRILVDYDWLGQHYTRDLRITNRQSWWSGSFYLR